MRMTRKTRTPVTVYRVALALAIMGLGATSMQLYANAQRPTPKIAIDNETKAICDANGGCVLVTRSYLEEQLKEVKESAFNEGYDKCEADRSPTL